MPRLKLFKIFGGKRYIKEGVRANKVEADKLAEKLRKSGHFVRVVKIRHPFTLSKIGYAIYAKGK